MRLRRELRRTVKKQQEVKIANIAQVSHPTPSPDYSGEGSCKSGVCTDKVFILQDTTVFIYNLKNFKLIKKFGRAGEGPGEFKIDPNDGRPMSMSLYKNNILVNSIAKMSYFDMDGNFKEEKKVGADALLFPVKNKFIAIGPISDETNNQFLGFRLMEKDQKKWKVLYLSKFNLGVRR